MLLAPLQYVPNGIVAFAFFANVWFGIAVQVMFDAAIADAADKRTLLLTALPEVKFIVSFAGDDAEKLTWLSLAMLTVIVEFPFTVKLVAPVKYVSRSNALLAVVPTVKFLFGIVPEKRVLAKLTVNVRFVDADSAGVLFAARQFQLYAPFGML